MHFETYDYITGNLIAQVPALDFGDLIQGQHCSKPAVLRIIADTETNITDSTVFLQNKGAWKDSAFGYYLSPDFVPSVEAGSASISRHFSEVPDATSMSSGGVSVPFSGNSSDYLWLDIQVFQIGTTEANYRLFFNYT